MKKIWILILTALLLIGLCACGGESTDPTNAPENNVTQQPTNAPEGDATQAPACTHTYEESITKEPTCVEVGEKTFKCTQCSHSYTEAVDLVDHTWVDASCTAPKYCHVCNITEGDALEHTFAGGNCTTANTCTVCGTSEETVPGHTFADATCAAPKTCTVCGVTEGEKADHNYKDGACTGCGKAQNFGTLSGTWFLEGVDADCGEYEQMRLFFWEADKSAGFSAAFFHPLEYKDQAELDCILANGYAERNGYYEYFYDVTEFNGKYYHSAMYGTTAAGYYKQNGNTITIDLVCYFGGDGVLTLQRVSETVLKVVSIDGVVSDELVSRIILSVGQFTWVEDEGIG